MEKISLPLPAIRCLSKEEAACYLGIGVTLLSELKIPYIKLGRRCLYDKVDLDDWLEEYKQREHGRAKEEALWPNKPKKASTGGKTLATGGLQQRSQTAKEYAKVLGLKSERMPKHY
ncbi:MAG: helix-turn-helix domain-containing protein [Nitrosomonas sp.]|nr:helix-turn-helix domain-containing protein [Nitrosomonas sp.]MDP1950092.1 helix-turn-helix domain-containing protein [Nitrosomonas sp.]